MNRALVYLAGVAWSSIFGLSFLVTKGALASFSPFELLFLRFLLASFALSLLAGLGFLKLSFRGKPWGQLLLLCLLQPLVYFTCETLGIRETASSTGGLILGALPAVVAFLGAVLLKEGLRPGQVFGLVLSLSGVVLVVVFGAAAPGSTDSLRGILLLVGALLSAGFYNILSRKASAAFTPVEITFAMMASGAFVFGLVAVAGRFAAPGPGLAARLDLPSLFAIGYLGLLSSVVAFFLVNLSLARLKAGEAAVFGTLTTLVSLLAGVLVRGEALGPLRLAGAALIVAGVWATSRRGRTRGGASTAA